MHEGSGVSISRFLSTGTVLILPYEGALYGPTYITLLGALYGPTYITLLRGTLWPYEHVPVNLQDGLG